MSDNYDTDFAILPVCPNCGGQLIKTICSDCQKEQWPPAMEISELTKLTKPFIEISGLTKPY